MRGSVIRYWCESKDFKPMLSTEGAVRCRRNHQSRRGLVANRVSKVFAAVIMGAAGMNPFPGWWSICATRCFSRKKGGGYGQSLNPVRYSAASGRRLLSSLRRPHGVGTGARTRRVRLALRLLRRTDRSGDSCPPGAESCAFQRWAHRRRPEASLSR